MSTTLTPEQEADLFSGSRRTGLYATFIIFLVLINALVIAKLVLQPKPTKVSIWEDVTLAIGTIGADISLIYSIISTHYGLGLHIVRIVSDKEHFPGNIINIFKGIFVAGISSSVSNCFVKISLLLLYRRMFLVHQNWLRYVWIGNIVYTVCLFIGSEIYIICQCLPPWFFWERYYELLDVTPPHPVNGKCDPLTIQHSAVTIFLNVTSDAALLILPLGTLLKLNIELHKKIGLLVVFGFGVVTCVVEIARIILLFLKTETTTDPTYDVAVFEALTGTITATTVICASWPTIVPRMWRFFKNLATPQYYDTSWTGYENIERPPRREREPGAPTTPLGQSNASRSARRRSWGERGAPGNGSEEGEVYGLWDLSRTEPSPGFGQSQSSGDGDVVVDEVRAGAKATGDKDRKRS